MSKFKAGDKVCCTNKFWTLNGEDMLGKIYTVVKQETDSAYGCITIAEDEPTQLYDQGGFELVKGAALDVENSNLIDNQDHYKKAGVEPIDLMKQNFTKEEYSGFLQGNIIKYLLRFKRKNGVEDLKKALTYLTWLIEQEEK